MRLGLAAAGLPCHRPAFLTNNLRFAGKSYGRRYNYAVTGGQMPHDAHDLALEYVSGGFYVARLASRAEYMSPDLIPDRVVSASGCISQFFPDVWSIEWSSTGLEERRKQAFAFGISDVDLPVVTAWATESFSVAFGWPNAFYSLRAAQEARAKFLPSRPEVVVLGVGLHQSHVEAVLQVAKPEEPAPGIAPAGATGLFECVSRRAEVPPGGDVAGFELLALHSGLLTCSWLCNGLEKVCAERLGVRTNGRGLVHSHAEAMRCAELISSDEVGAEPGLWLPWLLTLY